MTPLQEKTYQLLKNVPRGRVTTYKALAQALHSKGYRAIGQFLRNNPYSFEACPDPSADGRRVPCHRVVASDGTIGGFMGAKSGKNIQKKIALLRSEGIRIINNRVGDFRHVLFTFS